MEIILLDQDNVSVFSALIQVFEKEFEMQNFQIPSQEHLSKTLQNENFRVFVAMESDQVLGGITLYVLPAYYTDKPQAYIYDLAVLSSHQRNGIGTRLVEAILQYGRKYNFAEIFVQADKMDDHAVAFYKSIPGAIEEDVSHFSYRL